MSKRVLVLVAALALTASACTGSATVTQAGSAGNGTEGEPTSAPVTDAEPTARPTVDETPTTVPEVTGPPQTTPTPSGPPLVSLPTEAFSTDSVMGLSSDGVFAYTGTSSPWNDPTNCDGDPAESLAVVDVVTAASGVLTVAAAGLEQVGDVRQMVFDDAGSVAILSSCGPPNEATLWMQRADVASDGRIISLGERIDMSAPGENDPYLSRWIDDDTVEVRVVIEVEPDDFDSWLVERRQLSLTSGQVLAREQFGFYDDSFSAGAELVTDNGTYRVVEDPDGRVGCEGFGVASTLELDTGDEQRLALAQPGLVFAQVSDLHMTADGYIAWTSGCEGFASAYVGRVQSDGTIADAHQIDTFLFVADTAVDFQYYRLSDDGFLHAVGRSFDPDFEVRAPGFLRYDLSEDPHFVNTADPAPQIEQEPLFAAVGDDGTWHVGDTLAADAACGARTLYGQTPGGFVRAFPAGVELDAIVDVDIGETRQISYPDGDFVSRTVVVQTECPASYEGRRVWFGIETDNIIWGLVVERADLGEVADVLSVRDVFEEGTEFVETSIVTVELLDGTVAEVELVRLPSEG